ncbi:MAG: hypothetical protein H6Q92_1791 [Nitrospirae bacterium]|nr:hypothetical protein [Nitrospirota bacterium]
MNINSLLRLFIVLTAVIIGSAACLFSGNSGNRSKIEIVSYVVRDRVISLDRIEMRSMVIVAFKILPKIKTTSGLVVHGELYHNDRLLSEDTISHLDSSGDNLGFDIPLTHGDFDREALYNIPEGRYRIVIKVYDGQRRPLAQTTKEVMRNDIARTFEPSERKAERPLFTRVDSKLQSTLLQEDLKRTTPGKVDYLLFQSNPLSRVYNDDLPGQSDQISEMSTEIAAAEYRSVTFSIHALRNLGRVGVEMSALKGEKGTLGADSLRIGALTELTEVVKSESSVKTVSYRLAPRIIEPKDVVIPENRTQTYWITVKAKSDAVPGEYNGVITIKPQFGRAKEIPFHVRVLPLRLSDTDIQYGMMMDYAFYELDNQQWTEVERTLLKQRGFQLYQDLRDHGMTVIYPHSYFYFKTDTRGQPVLESLKESLKAYKKLNFPGPFCWYIGHLLQTAKTKHPGSILSYNEEVAIRRLHDLLSRYESMAKELGIPKEKLVVQVVDEPDAGDRARVEAGKKLNRILRERGFRTLITRSWPEVDIVCTGTPDEDHDAGGMRSRGNEWWIYPNSALKGKNLSYTRYIFGFGAWRWGVKGVVPWTFQMSQGCNGNPFTVLDGAEGMVAYPGEKGDILSTPLWEIIREGINDYKYIYLLERMILSEKKKGNRMASAIEQKLKHFKESLGQGPGWEENRFGDWTPERFETRRNQIVDWVLELIDGAPYVHQRISVN